MDIHIFWQGAFILEDVETTKKLDDENRDYGVYQVYGQHPLYGNSALLYIGQANLQTFGKRLREEKWRHMVSDPDSLRFYAGRLAGQKLVTEEEWGERIDKAEKLLIYSHLPAHNTQNTKSIPEDYVSDVHIFNWDNFRDLSPEVSGKRRSSMFDHISEDSVYSYERLKQ